MNVYCVYRPLDTEAQDHFKHLFSIVKRIEVLYTCFLLHVTSNGYLQIGWTSTSFKKIRFQFYTITYWLSSQQKKNVLCHWGPPFSSAAPVHIVHAWTSAHVFFWGPNSRDISKSLNIYKIDRFRFSSRPDWKAAVWSAEHRAWVQDVGSCWRQEDERISGKKNHSWMCD